MEMGNSHPLVSVILPFYNAPFLRDSIESILNQSYSNFELILINNGSTDESCEVADSYSTLDKVRIAEEPNRGVVYAANKGIQLAEGDFIARMDADDVADIRRLEKQINFFDDNPGLDVVSSLVDYLGSNENKGFIHYVDWINSIVSTEDIYLNQFVEFPMANPSTIFRKEVFEKFGLYKEGDFPEDYELFLRLQSSGIRMGKVSENLLSWRDSENRLTRIDKRYSQDAFFRIKSKYLARWLSEHNLFHPNVYVWGAGRLSRRRSDHLRKEGINVVKYIDLSERNNTIYYQNIPDSSNAFIVSYVANRGARSEIRTFLNSRGFIEGKSYILAS